MANCCNSVWLLLALNAGLCLFLGCVIAGVVLYCLDVNVMVGTLPLGPLLILVPFTTFGAMMVLSFVAGFVSYLYRTYERPPRPPLDVPDIIIAPLEPFVNSVVLVPTTFTWSDQRWLTAKRGREGSTGDTECAVCYLPLNPREHQQCSQCQEGKVCVDCMDVMLQHPSLLECPVCRLPWPLYTPPLV